MPCEVEASTGEMLSSRTACAVQGPCTGVPMATQSKYNKNTSSASSWLNYHVLVINTESRAELPGLLEPPEPLTQPQLLRAALRVGCCGAQLIDGTSLGQLFQKPEPVHPAAPSPGGGLAKSSRSLTCVG